MKVSYDYTNLLKELKNDLYEGLISSNDVIKVVRGDSVSNYCPIIDYYYNDEELKEKYEELTVATVIAEMDRLNKIL